MEQTRLLGGEGRLILGAFKRIGRDLAGSIGTNPNDIPDRLLRGGRQLIAPGYLNLRVGRFPDYQLGADL